MIGKTLKHYQIDSILGKGGMGTVYRARDTRLQRPVAIKVLSAELTSDPERKQRFFHEARAAAAVTHPAIAQVYDVDEVDGVTFIAMELVEGQTIRQLVTERDLDLLAALEVSIQVGEGLARAHETGIVHRDIKSENIMVTRDGHAKILDFGLAKLNPIHNVDSGSGAEARMSQMATVALTHPGMVVGTLAYMSPEQARGRDLDHRSDIFSFGVTIYEMATGQLPFSGASPLDTMHAIAFEETRPITTLRQNLPPELQRIISRCLRKRPEDRYPDASALVADLKVLRRDLESGVTRVASFSDRFRDRMERLKDLSPKTLFWIGGIAVVAALVLIVALANRQGLFWPGLGITVVGLYLYRKLRHRTPRLMKRFSAKAARIPEVRLIIWQQKRVTVVVDHIRAKVYLRINSLMEEVNSKLFFGEPLTVTVRDDLATEEFRKLLYEPGVLYLRDDAPESPSPQES
jgi:serine/threonine protein kinase